MNIFNLVLGFYDSVSFVNASNFQGHDENVRYEERFPLLAAV